ncbi:MAG: hypothetical protein PHD73_11950 [Sediminibacterium sp.]|nr:hypothetical protein [Sediminibacterium sp.]
MNEENKNRLSSIFTKLKAQQTQRDIESENLKQQRDIFSENFKSLCQNLIEPKMLEFKEVLNSNEYGCFVNYCEPNSSGKGIETEPRIKLEISKNKNRAFYASDKLPHIMFIGDTGKEKVTLHENTMFPNSGGHAGMKNISYEIDGLTSDIIEKEITDSIENILGNKY